MKISNKGKTTMKSMTDYFADWFDKDGKHNSRSIFTAADMENAFQRGWFSRIDALSGEYRRDQEDLAKYRSEVPGLDAEINRLKLELAQWQGWAEDRGNTVAEYKRQNDDLRATLVRADNQQERQRENIRQDREQIGKMQSQIDGLQARVKSAVAQIQGWVDHSNKQDADLKRVIAERDEWHHAYDKLVSDVVHGRPHTIGVDKGERDMTGWAVYDGNAMVARGEMEARDTCGAEPSPQTVNECAKAAEDVAVYGTGVLFIDGDGQTRHIPLDAFVMKPPHNPHN